ncbi:MAG: NADH-quinone oxidoreductase subunit J [Planctomycetota bacterium]|nr:MAG: NADH-quinone oxidoreductase subunit J [Planctomycetota bacterium]
METATALHIAFFILATAVVAGALITLWSRYVVHSAFGLMLALLGIAGLYVTLGSDFLAVVQVIVYVGGVVVLYLFGIMLTPPDLEERCRKRVGVGTLLAFIVLGLLGTSALGIHDWVGLSPSGGGVQEGSVIREIGLRFMDHGSMLLAFELASVVLLVALIGAVFIARRVGVIGKNSNEEGGSA